MPPRSSNAGSSLRLSELPVRSKADPHERGREKSAGRLAGPLMSFAARPAWRRHNVSSSRLPVADTTDGRFREIAHHRVLWTTSIMNRPARQQLVSNGRESARGLPTPGALYLFDEFQNWREPLIRKHGARSRNAV